MKHGGWQQGKSRKGDSRMDKEGVIAILEFYKEIDGEISIYRRIITDYENQYYNPVQGVEYSDTTKGKYATSNPTERLALHIPDCVRDDMRCYENKVKTLQMLKSQILQEISRLKLKEKTIIFDYYIHGMKWEQVAERSHYSDRQCKNIRDAAVEKLVARFQNNAYICGFRKPT